MANDSVLLVHDYHKYSAVFVTTLEVREHLFAEPAATE
jgi:hypothetical protein